MNPKARIFLRYLDQVHEEKRSASQKLTGQIEKHTASQLEARRSEDLEGVQFHTDKLGGLEVQLKVVAAEITLITKMQRKVISVFGDR